MDARTAESLLTFAEEARPRIRAADDASALDEVESRYAAMIEAMDWFLALDHADEAYRLASALVPFWIATKRIDDGDSWFAKALDTPRGTDPHRARALYDHGYLVFWAGRYELSEDRFSDAIAMADALGNHELEALALAGAARVALNTDIAEAVRLLRRAVDVTANTPDSPGHGSAMHVLGVALQMSGDLEAAREVMSKRLEWGRAHDNSAAVFIESANLSMVERRLGNLDRAEQLSRAALRIAVGKRDEMAIPWVINGLAAVTAAKGDHRRGATLVGIAEGLLDRAGGEWPPDERGQYEGTLEALQAAPPDADVEERRRAGRGMSPDDAVTFALSDEGR